VRSIQSILCDNLRLSVDLGARRVARARQKNRTIESAASRLVSNLRDHSTPAKLTISAV
jgi:hypothetical protein